MEQPGLQGRHKDIGGELTRKHGNILIGVLRRILGPSFAEGVSIHTRLSDALAENRISEQHQIRLYQIYIDPAFERSLALSGVSMATGNVAAFLIQEYEHSVGSPADTDQGAVLELLSKWTAGDRNEAEHWYRSVPIPSFGNRTAEQVLRDGSGQALKGYVEGLLAGEFA